MKIFKSFKTILLLVVIVLVLYAMYKVYNNVSVNMETKTPNESKSELFEEPKLKICLIYAVWCHHCEKYLDSGTFMRTYQELKKQSKYDKVVFEQIDYDKNKKLVEQYNITGFPSIVAVSSDGNVLANFNGDRYDSRELVNFVNINLKKI